jgi:hypothetical protein
LQDHQIIETETFAQLKAECECFVDEHIQRIVIAGQEKRHCFVKIAVEQQFLDGG